jgi:hypothetical protein
VAAGFGDLGADGWRGRMVAWWCGMMGILIHVLHVYYTDTYLIKSCPAILCIHCIYIYVYIHTYHYITLHYITLPYIRTYIHTYIHISSD